MKHIKLYGTASEAIGQVVETPFVGMTNTEKK